MTAVGKEDPMREYILAAYQEVMREFQESDAYQALEQNEEKEQPDDNEKKKGLAS